MLSGEVYVLTAVDYVAQIGEDKYTTLEEAMAVGGEITMLADYEITEYILVENTVILDLNGCTVTGPDDGTANWYAFVVAAGGDMTLKDSAGTGELYAKCYGVETKGGSFTLDGAKITATQNTKIGTAIVNYGGSVTVKSGTVSGAHRAISTSGYFSNASTTILGGTITGILTTVEEYVTDGYTSTVSSALNTYDAEAGYEWVLSGEVYVLTAIKNLLGDVDLDGDVDATDWTILRQYLLGNVELTDSQKDVADVNSDGDINATDWTLIRQHLLGNVNLHD